MTDIEREIYIDMMEIELMTRERDVQRMKQGQPSNRQRAAIQKENHVRNQQEQLKQNSTQNDVVISVYDTY